MAKYISPRGRDGARKANNFAAFASENGWHSKVSSNEAEVRVFARRGENETLECIWIDGCWSGQSAYTLAGERIRVHNLSAASKITQNQPNSERLAKATRKRKRQTGIEYAQPEAIDIDSLRTSLPFDAESSDEEIEAVLHRRNIAWVNTISGQIDSTRVDADRQFKIVRKNGNEKIKADYITFCATEGYRAVYLNSIVAVS